MEVTPKACVSAASADGGESDSGLWYVGVILSVLATLAGAVGKVLMKKAHMVSKEVQGAIRGDVKAAELAKIKTKFWTIKLIGLLCIIIINPICDVAAFSFTAQSVIAPLAGLTLVWNTMLAPCLLDETPTRLHYISAFCVFAGVATVGVSGNHTSSSYTLAEIRLLFRQTSFIIYAVLLAIFLVFLVGSIHHPRSPPWLRRFAWGAAGGTVGGNLFILKATLETLGAWDAWEFYLMLLGTIAVAAGGLKLMDMGLKRYDALFIATMYQGFFIFFGAASGIAFYRDLDCQASWKYVVYPLGLVICLAGVAIVVLTADAEATEVPIEKATSADKGAVEFSDVELQLDLADAETEPAAAPAARVE
jgi:hypothetical protein